MKASIDEADIKRMNAFPALGKSRVMEKIMSLTPLKTAVRSDSNSYEKCLIRLRDDGFMLLNVEALETAFTTVWYRKTGVAGFSHVDVTMMLWESQGSGDTTTIITWRL